nr:hypothetical protein [uncultured Carboxylicivirga sp.]
MKNFFKKIIEGSSIKPSVLCQKSFNDNFRDAINVEWINKEALYEAVFYRNNIEHIALFDSNGMLLEYRQNLPVEYLPEQIKTLVLEKGEIMNSVLKNKVNTVEYEIIYKDKSHQRFLILLSELGVQKEEIML